MKLALLVLASGCNSVYAIDETGLVPDAAPPADSDGDSVIDAADNCPARANDQDDNDEDGVGDVCDNCPLVANPRQESGGDEDAVGDACDARPDVTGDCLVLFDSFGDASAFTSHWGVLSNSSAPTPVIEAWPGFVSIDPAAFSAVVSVVALVADGQVLSGLHDVQAVARTELMVGASFAAVTRASGFQTGYGCGALSYGAGTIGVQTTSNAADNAVSFALMGLSAEPTAMTTGRVRLFAGRGTTDEPHLGCRVELGAAAGVGQFTRAAQYEPPDAGGSGVRVGRSRAELTAVALYRFIGPSCPAPIYR